jgi:hypothetical protein
MPSADESSKLKAARYDLGKRIDAIGKEQFPEIVKLSVQLKELIEDIESTQEKEKGLYNPAIITRMRIAKKGFKLSKEISHFEMEVARGFEGNRVTKDAGKRFISIAKLMKENKMAQAKIEFRHFEDIIGLQKRCEKADADIHEMREGLRKERTRMKLLQEEMSVLEKEVVDQEKVRRYWELASAKEELVGIRERYIESLVSLPVAEMLGRIGSLRERLPRFPDESAITELKKFFSDYPELGSMDAWQLCACFDYNDKKLSHICPETTRFRKTVVENRAFFETMRDLKQTTSLAADIEDEDALVFFSKKAEVARRIVERIRELKKDKLSDREEYEKSERIRKRKEELSGISKEALEADLEANGRLLKILDSDDSKGWGREPGLLSGILSIFRGG